MDNTCLHPSFGSLFVIPAVGMSTHVERNDYVVGEGRTKWAT